VIEAVAPNGADEALAIGVLPRTAGCDEDFFDAQTFRSTTELITVAAVAVANQKARGLVEREGFSELLRNPVGTENSVGIVLQGVTSMAAVG
jgi:hypothetical protein